MKLLDDIRAQMSELPDPSLIVLKEEEWLAIRKHMQESEAVVRDPTLLGVRTLFRVPVALNEKWDGRKVLNKVWAQAYRAHTVGAL